MASLSSVHARPGEFSFSADEVVCAARVWLDGEDDAFRLFERFLRSTGTRERRYAFSLDEILSFAGQESRAEFFRERGEALAAEAIRAVVDSAGLACSEVDTVVFTSCTAPLIPSLDAAILPRLGFRSTVNRVPIYQYGCAGGVAGLALARRLADSGTTVLMVSVELCSLLFRRRESTAVQLLGSALFADGAAAAVVKPNGPRLHVIGARSHLLPNTTHLMGYNIREDGNHLRLEKELPDVLQAHIEPVVQDFLRDHSLSPSDVPWWIIHPGGMKILEGVQHTFALDANQFEWASDVLRDVGNMSSATVFFALAKFISSGVATAGDPVLMIGIGPGLTVELVLFRY